MTKDEAIEKVIDAFSAWEAEYDTGDDWSEEHEARDMAIEALAVEAIPIEWMAQWTKKQNYGIRNGKVFIATVLNSMIDDWQEERNNL